MIIHGFPFTLQTAIINPLVIINLISPAVTYLTDQGLIVIVSLDNALQVWLACWLVNSNVWVSITITLIDKYTGLLKAISGFFLIISPVGKEALSREVPTQMIFACVELGSTSLGISLGNVAFLTSVFLQRRRHKLWKITHECQPRCAMSLWETHHRVLY